MNVLLVAGVRVGGTVIGEWLGFELGMEYIHEPYSHWRFKTNRDISPQTSIKYKNSGLISKALPGPELEQILKDRPKWDKIIGLTREDETECAISLLRASEIDKWREEYYIDKKWIDEKQSDIDKMKNQVVNLRNEILNNNIIKCQITYEGIYETKLHRNKLKEYLGIDRWKFEEMLEPKYRYRKYSPEEKTNRRLM